MDLKELLLKKEIIQIKKPDEEPFTLSSGKKSRLFINIKGASLDPATLKEITYLSSELFIELESTDGKYDYIASVAVGGVPIATALSLRTMTPQIIIRPEKHNTGIQTQIIGDNGKDNLRNKRCLLIDDVATSGGSIIRAVSTLDKVGAICNDVIVIVDRNEGAQELCEKNKLNLYSIIEKSDFGIREEL